MDSFHYRLDVGGYKSSEVRWTWTTGNGFTLRSWMAADVGSGVTASLRAVSDTSAPVLDGNPTVNRTVPKLTYDEDMDMSTVPAASAFTVKVTPSGSTEEPRTLASNGVAVSSKAVTLTLFSAVTASDTVTVSYAVPTSNPIQDLAGYDAAALTTRSVDNNNAANSPPVFSNVTLTRGIAENTAATTNVGAVIPATDTDGDTLTYTMEGTDVAPFDFNATTRQITTKNGITYDHEAKSSFSVTIKADDGNGSTDTVIVTICVADLAEPSAAPAGGPRGLPRHGPGLRRQHRLPRR